VVATFVTRGSGASRPRPLDGRKQHVGSRGREHACRRADGRVSRSRYACCGGARRRCACCALPGASRRPPACASTLAGMPSLPSASPRPPSAAARPRARLARVALRRRLCAAGCCGVSCCRALDPFPGAYFPRRPLSRLAAAASLHAAAGALCGPAPRRRDARVRLPPCGSRRDAAQEAPIAAHGCARGAHRPALALVPRRVAAVRSVARCRSAPCVRGFAARCTACGAAWRRAHAVALLSRRLAPARAARAVPRPRSCVQAVLSAPRPGAGAEAPYTGGAVDNEVLLREKDACGVGFIASVKARAPPRPTTACLSLCRPVPPVR